jgi:hypothetical protein
MLLCLTNPLLTCDKQTLLPAFFYLYLPERTACVTDTTQSVGITELLQMSSRGADNLIWQSQKYPPGIPRGQ